VQKPPWAILVGVFSQVTLAIRGIVLVQPAIDVVGLANVKTAVGVLENIDEILGHNKSVIG
jgi:hypothetical protein